MVVIKTNKLHRYKEQKAKLLSNATELKIVSLCNKLLYLQEYEDINIKLVWDNELERAAIIDTNGYLICALNTFTLSDYDNIRHLMSNTSMKFSLYEGTDFDLDVSNCKKYTSEQEEPNPLKSLHRATEEVNLILDGHLKAPMLEDLWAIFDNLEGCEYCGMAQHDIYNPNIGIDTKLFKGDYIMQYGVWGKGLDIALYNTGMMDKELAEFVIPIKYCPMCGVSLK